MTGRPRWVAVVSAALLQFALQSVSQQPYWDAAAGQEVSPLDVLRTLAGPGEADEICRAPTGFSNTDIASMQEELCQYARTVVQTVCCDGEPMGEP